MTRARIAVPLVCLVIGVWGCAEGGGDAVASDQEAVSGACLSCFGSSGTSNCVPVPQTVCGAPWTCELWVQESGRFRYEGEHSVSGWSLSVMSAQCDAIGSRVSSEYFARGATLFRAELKDKDGTVWWDNWY